MFQRPKPSRLPTKSPRNQYDPKMKRHSQLTQRAKAVLAGVFTFATLLFLFVTQMTIDVTRPLRYQFRSRSENQQLLQESSSANTDSCHSAYDIVPCNATHFEMRYGYFDCGPYEETMRPFLNDSSRLLMRGIYMGVVGPEKSSIGKQIHHEHGFGFPISVRHNEKGRAVYSETDIPKGSLVWDSRRNTCCFENPDLYRQFILNMPEYLTCEALSFSYVSQYPEAGGLSSTTPRPIICVDTDQGAQLNDGGPDGSNIGCPSAMSQSDCNYSGKMFALRDIVKGEELLCYYDAFAIDFGWEHFGMGNTDDGND